MKNILLFISLLLGFINSSFGQVVEIIGFEDSLYFDSNKTVSSLVHFRASGFDDKLKVLIRLKQSEGTNLFDPVVQSPFNQEIVLEGNKSGNIPIIFKLPVEEISGSYFFQVQYSIDGGKSFTRIFYNNPLEIKVLKKGNIASSDISRVFIGGTFDFFAKLSVKDLAGSIEIFSPQALGKNDGISFKAYSTRAFSKPAEESDRNAINVIPDFSSFNAQSDSVVLKSYILNYKEKVVFDNWGLRLGYMHSILNEGDSKKGVYAAIGASIELVNRTITTTRDFDTLSFTQRKILVPDTLRTRVLPKTDLIKRFDYYVGIDVNLRYYVSKSFDLRLIGTPGFVFGSDSIKKVSLFSNIGFDLQEKATGLNISLGGEVRLQDNFYNYNFYTLYLGTSFSFEKLKGLFDGQN